jgi:hypothetical protein
MESLATWLLQGIGALLLLLVLEILGEGIISFAMGRTTGLGWLHNRWWAQRLYRQTSPAWLLPVWLVAGATILAAWLALTRRSDWVGSLGLILFFVVPMLTLGMTMWWLRSPFRHRR